MNDVTETVTEAGILVPRAVTDALGWASGQPVTIRLLGSQIAISPVRTPAEVVERRAAAYLIQHVGDAAAAGPATANGEQWEVPVYLSYEDRQVGTLVFTAAGELLRDASSSPDSMRAAARAA